MSRDEFRGLRGRCLWLPLFAPVIDAVTFLLAKQPGANAGGAGKHACGVVGAKCARNCVCSHIGQGEKPEQHQTWCADDVPALL